MGKVAVLGLGISGKGAVRWLSYLNKSVIGIDKKTDPVEGCERVYKEEEVPWDVIETLIVSPGISPLHSVYVKALSRKIPVIGEAELALAHYSQKMVAVTGTNGKTTVTLLVEHVLNACGKKAKALGNVGVSLCDYLLQEDKPDYLVVELSSYQLETMVTPVFEAAVLLNITPDHLDRYASMREYAAAKCRLQNLVKRKDSFFVSKRGVQGFEDLLTNAVLFTQDPSKEFSHDEENRMAAFLLCQALGVSKEEFARAEMTFKKPLHRIERVCSINSVAYYDDSKGTNIDAVIQAVKTMEGPVILIAGGVDKGASYLLWKEVFQDKVKTIIAIGQAKEKIARELGPFFPVMLCENMNEAVSSACKLSMPGDCVLLSPGCSSFDMFTDYAHRGEEFKRCVLEQKDRYEPKRDDDSSGPC